MLHGRNSRDTFCHPPPQPLPNTEWPKNRTVNRNSTNRNRTELGSPCPYLCCNYNPARLLERGFSGLRPEIGKKNRKMNNWFCPPPENGEELEEHWKNGVGGHFANFWAHFSLFPGGGWNQHFASFPLSGWRPENPLLAGGQGHKSVYVSRRTILQKYVNLSVADRIVCRD